MTIHITRRTFVVKKYVIMVLHMKQVMRYG